MPQVKTMRKTGFLIALFAAALTGCGGCDSADDAFKPGADPATPTTPAAASLTITTSSATIPSDGSAPADIKVFARNANNQFVSAVPVTLSASSGGLSVTGSSTDATGMLAATLSPAGDPARRTITVTATSGTVTASVQVQVGGSVLTVQGPVSLNLQQSGTYTVTLVDAGNKPIVGKAVTVASARSNTLSAASVTTSATGQATFNLTASSGGNDTITVTSLGLSATQAVSVSSDAFTFTAPASNTEVALGATQSVTVNWKVAGVAQVGQTVNFSTTRGTVSPTAVTDGAGNATATISAANAGGAVVSAAAGTSTAQIAVEFVAQTPASIDIQPSAFSIGTGQTSTLTAVVRDLAGNLVKNKTVTFTLQDVTGGTLSLGTAVTDSQGRAQTVYTSSSTASANQGVVVTASVAGVTPKSVALTVARRELFISIGSGNTIIEVASNTQYQVDYAIQVTDANGAGVANVPLTVRLLSTRYYKGARFNRAQLLPTPGTGWDTRYSVTGSNTPSLAAACTDEDVNRNGQLDPGEDFNNSLRIEAGNIASVTPAAVTTDSTGLAIVSITYPQEFAYYLDVSLSANTTVQGTEYVRTSNFMLPGSSQDFQDTTIAPPGVVSPFGQANVCSNKD
jgi:hypothetical protein